MTRHRVLWAALVLVLVAALAIGTFTSPSGPSTIEGRVGALAAQVRCPTCNGLSVAESEAPLAQSAKQEIDAQVRAGRTDEEVRGYFVSRYGQSALMSPPRRGVTALAWVLPVGVVLSGAVVVVLVVRTWRRRSVAIDVAPSAEDRALVDAALREHA